ncbi:unnamed protein product, partial [Arabidopsis halleri]
IVLIAEFALFAPSNARCKDTFILFFINRDIKLLIIFITNLFEKLFCIKLSLYRFSSVS